MPLRKFVFICTNFDALGDKSFGNFFKINMAALNGRALFAVALILRRRLRRRRRYCKLQQQI